MTSPAKTAWILYRRVSTAKQGASGLGLEAQEAALSTFLASRPEDTIVGTFTEIESGREDSRAQLAAAINECRLRGARLLIAKLDRLARDVAFISNLMRCDVPFTVADMPNADSFRLHIEACIAEDEARKISARTKAALAAAKARGTILGGFRGRAPAASEQAAGRATQAAAALIRAQRLAPVLAALRAEGVTTYAALADALTARGYPAPRGGSWSPTQVMREAKRIAA